VWFALTHVTKLGVDTKRHRALFGREKLKDPHLLQRLMIHTVVYVSYDSGLRIGMQYCTATGTEIIRDSRKAIEFTFIHILK
jgi:hypothetical protein